jgi:hypothetical protein
MSEAAVDCLSAAFFSHKTISMVLMAVHIYPGQLVHKRCAGVAIHAAGAAAKNTQQSTHCTDEGRGSGNTAINLGEEEREQSNDMFNWVGWIALR